MAALVRDACRDRIGFLIVTALATRRRTKLLRIGLEAARSLAEQAVAERGSDYVYERTDLLGCAYWNQDGSPSCLVGQILYRLGAEPFPHCEENLEGIDALENHMLEMDPVTLHYLERLQAQQDSGSTWGQALAYAEEGLKQDSPELYYKERADEDFVSASA